MICHDALEYLVMHNKEVVTGEIIRALVKREIKPFKSSGHRVQLTGASWNPE
jgi:hypothetical protein